MLHTVTKVRYRQTVYVVILVFDENLLQSLRAQFSVLVHGPYWSSSVPRTSNSRLITNHDMVANLQPLPLTSEYALLWSLSHQKKTSILGPELWYSDKASCPVCRSQLTRVGYAVNGHQTGPYNHVMVKCAGAVKEGTVYQDLVVNDRSRRCRNPRSVHCAERRDFDTYSS